MRLPPRVNNPVSFAGIAIVTTMAVLFFVLLILDIAGAVANPYIGLVLYVTVPVILVFGLLIIPLGTWRASRRRRLHPNAPEWPAIDFNNPRVRSMAVVILILTAVNILIVSLAAYGGVHYMDSSEFCGEQWHTAALSRRHRPGPEAGAATG